MHIRNYDNKILGGFRAGGAVSAVFALVSVLGSLSLVFSEVKIFSVIALIVLFGITFVFSRDIIAICGIMIPCLFVLVATNDTSLPALYFGLVFTLGTSLYLCLSGRAFFPILSAVLSYGAASFILDPIKALPVLAPFALGILAALMLRTFSLTGIAGTLSALILCTGLSFFLAAGGDLAAIGDSLRAYFLEAFMGVSSELIVIEESFAEMLSAYMVNILPGFIFAAVSAVIYIACSLAISLIRLSGMLDRLDEDKRSFTLSPVSGVIFLSCFLLSTAFAVEGGDYEMAGAVVDNILTALSLPFILLGCRATREFFEKKLFRRLPNKQKISGAAVAVLFLMIPGGALAIFMSAGIAYSMMPIYRAVIDKMKAAADKQ